MEEEGIETQEALLSRLDLGKILQYADLVTRVIGVVEGARNLEVGETQPAQEVNGVKVKRKKYDLVVGPLKRTA